MKRSSLRAFGFAFFLIGALLTINSKVNIPYISSESENVDQYKENITKLEHQLDEANKQISLLKQNEQSNTQSQTDIHSTKEMNDDVVTGTLYIYRGLTPADVAQKLKDLGVINNSVEMELFLAQPEYAKSLQKGQFELNSLMSVEEIAAIITGKQQE